MGFWHREVLPGVFQIEDALGVCMTLLTGTKGALLVDAGYGIEDVASFVSTLTDHAVRVLLTHGHHDHILGTRWFGEAELFPGDLETASIYSKKEWRERVLQTAQERGIWTDEAAFLSFELPPLKPLQEGMIDLGGLGAQVIGCPGHTGGSAVLYIQEKALLLTGDNWNPCTWLFFPEAMPVRRYRQQMQKLLSLPFDHVLCPHRRELYERSMLENFIAGLTDENLAKASFVDTGAYPGIHTLQAQPCEGQVLVFDPDRS